MLLDSLGLIAGRARFGLRPGWRRVNMLLSFLINLSFIYTDSGWLVGGWLDDFGDEYANGGHDDLERTRLDDARAASR